MKLIRCINCGNVIDGHSAFCQNCGAKISKPAGCGKSGCIAVLVLVGLFFMLCAITAILSPNDNTRNQETAKDDNKRENRSAGTKNPAEEAKQKSEENPPENSANPFQVEVFSKDGALIFVQNFLEEKINSVVNVRIKFTSVANIQKLSDVIPEFVDLMQKNKEKIGTTINAKNVWSVEQEFCDKDNPVEKFSYYALVEFAEGKGYRVIFLSVGDVQIWPVASK